MMAGTRILVTGFGPYKENLNASGVLVQSLADELPAELTRLRQNLVFELISCDDSSRETEHRSLEFRLKQLLEQHRPAICIHTGQAPSYDRVTIERVATNRFMRSAIDPDRPTAYRSNLPGIEDLAALLASRGTPCAVSCDGGQHLCNHILYSSLHFAEGLGHRHRSGFVHVPVLPQQVITRYRDAPSMPLAMTRKALSLIINHVAEARRPLLAAPA